MVQGRKPEREQNQEIIELIKSLRLKLGFRSDRELAHYLRCQPHTISRWKTNDIPEYVKRLIHLINKNNITNL